MLTAHIFDRERGEDVEDWAGSVSELSDDQLLWVDLLEPSQDEKRAAWEGFGLAPLEADARSGTPTAALELGDDFIRESPGAGTGSERQRGSMTSSRSSVISRIAYRTPSRPTPDRFAPPYGMWSTRNEFTSLTISAPTSSCSNAL